MNPLRGTLDRISKFFWPRHNIEIKSGQSVIIIGKPGTGKSTLLRWLLKEVKSIVVYDSKYDPEEWPQQDDYSLVEKASELALHSRVVLRCKTEWLYSQEDWNIENHPWSVALEHPMRRGNTVAVFDEALATWPLRGGHPGTHRLVQQGRSFGVTVIVGSQLANNLDTRLLRMANHIFVMGPCKHKTELDAIFNANHVDIKPLEKLRHRQIAWWNDQDDQWVIFRSININHPHKLRERRIRPEEKRPLWVKFLLSSPLIAITEIILLPRLGIRLTEFLNGIIVFYLSSRAWRSRKWYITVQSGDWVPVAGEEVLSENQSRRRPPKTFKIV